jgi:hypothetical protein
VNTDQALADARAAAERLADYNDGPAAETEVEAVHQLANAFRELDAALSDTGPLPDPWARTALPSRQAMISALRAVPARMALIMPSTEMVADEILKALAGCRHRFTYHSNQLDDWCPWSLVSISRRVAESDDTQCPAGCPGSAIEEVPADER